MNRGGLYCTCGTSTSRELTSTDGTFKVYGNGLPSGARKQSSHARVRKAIRAAQRKEKKFGPPGYLDFVVSKGCIVGNARGYANCSSKIDFAHGHGEAGQDWRSGFGCCANHHTARGDSFHTLGPISFRLVHGVNPVVVAMQNVEEFTNQGIGL
jgi:hypothetical protein